MDGLNPVGHRRRPVGKRAANLTVVAQEVSKGRAAQWPMPSTGPPRRWSWRFARIVDSCL